ncbi:MAG: hypothetical protein OXI95_16165 [bacterium]|nr:hypothetical protein [bacterium]
MYFSPEVTENELPGLIRQFTDITGWRPWEKRLRWLEAQVATSTAMPYFWHERFELELAFAAMRKRHKTSGRYPRKNPAIEQQRFLSFVAMLVRCHSVSTQPAKTRLRGMILDSLKKDYGLGPLAYEMKIAAHLMSKGFDVTFHDLETGGGYDFLAVKDDLQLQVECKFVSGDIGRQIHLKRLYQFGEYLTPKLQTVLDQLRGGVFVHVKIPGRLHGQETQHSIISQEVISAIGGQNNHSTSNHNHVLASTFSIDSSPFAKLRPQDLRAEHLDEFALSRFGIRKKNMLVLFRPHRHAVIVALQSEKDDKVLTGIHQQLKDAASKQFTGALPAVMCCHLADIDETDLLGLQHKGDQGIGLDYMTADLIQRRPQLLAVTYTAPGSIERYRHSSGQFEQRSQRERGPAYTISNPNHPLAGDPRYTIF